jgi:hypothetical protein
MKKPRLDRGPKPNSAIAQPQMMITSGVRHVTEAGRRSSAVTAMRFLIALGADRDRRMRGGELMHAHANPKAIGARKISAQGSPAKSSSAIGRVVARSTLAPLAGRGRITSQM